MRSTRSTRSRQGMILFNVLVIVAIASVAVTVMIVAQDVEASRSTRLRDAAQAGAYARAGELSAVTALRRDALTAPESDNLAEPWAAISQQAIDIPGGRFSLTITDLQGRFSLNSLRDDADGAGALLLQRIGAVAGVAPETLTQIAGVVEIAGPLADEGLLRTAGVDPAALDALAPWTSVAPPGARINLNTVGEPLLSLMLDDPAAAAGLIRRREAAGFLTPSDVAMAGPLPLAGFTSDAFEVRTEVTVGEVTQSIVSRLERRGGDGAPQVIVRSRRRGAPAA